VANTGLQAGSGQGFLCGSNSMVDRKCSGSEDCLTYGLATVHRNGMFISDSLFYPNEAADKHTIILYKIQ
jgi:hypothetical protein